MGGDGTIHEVAKRLIGTEIAIGVVPTGSGNGFARHLGLPMNFRKAIRACAGLRVEIIDTGTVNGAPFINMMGIGFDASIADAFAAPSARPRDIRERRAARLARSPAEDYEVTWTAR